MNTTAEEARQMMEYVWELNTLVNGTHEGRCLASRFSARGEEFLAWLQSARLGEEQREFLKNEFSLAVPRLSQEAAALQMILSVLEKAQQAIS